MNNYLTFSTAVGLIINLFFLHQDSTTCKYKTCQRLNKQIIFSANSYLKQHMRVHTLRTRRKLFIANIVANLSFLRVTLMSIFEATPERKVLLQCIHSAFGDGDGFITLNAHLIFPASRPPVSSFSRTTWKKYCMI